ncbi:MAG TPA: CPBP family intramembrane glutamic endopeptidase [Gemmatimonadaceae bacterium]|nr:CPBP family intramembrane glutamic endopeptidase [Gemmatimonadaceae bacterium]
MSSPALSWPRVYWRQSRAHRYSLLFALPLLLAYEVMAAVLGHGEPQAIRNGADVLLKSVFITLLGARGPLVFGALLIGVSLWLVVRDMRAHGRRLAPRIFAGMMAESIVLALAFGVVVASITTRVLAPFAAMVQAPMQQLDTPTQLMVSLGAGLYEELLFRVLLVGAIAALGTRVLGWQQLTAAIVAVGVGALVFSAFHYVGPFGDPLEAGSFTFRLIAGIFFSALFVTRGFGITAWTHALYDVFLLFG